MPLPALHHITLLRWMEPIPPLNTQIARWGLFDHLVVDIHVIMIMISLKLFFVLSHKIEIMGRQ